MTRYGGMWRSCATLVVLGGAALFGQMCTAAESPDASPYDRNPGCLERTTAADAPECVLPSDETGRRRIFGKPAPAARPSSGTAPSSSGGTGSGLMRR